MERVKDNSGYPCTNTRNSKSKREYNFAYKSAEGEPSKYFKVYAHNDEEADKLAEKDMQDIPHVMLLRLAGWK